MDITKLPDNPFTAFGQWYEKALERDSDNPNWVVLATARNNTPSARVVLLKQWDDAGFVFFTNYGSEKAQALQENPQASLLFYWDSLFQQVRITGNVKKISREQSTRYFHSRPLESRIGAWASKQSQPLASRQELDESVQRFRDMFADEAPKLPDFWGGYRLSPCRFELWQGEHARLHQRLVYTLTEGSNWKKTLLYP